MRTLLRRWKGIVAPVGKIEQAHPTGVITTMTRTATERGAFDP